jgi:hypothetical protein
LDDRRVLNISPDGEYFYRYRQGPDEIELNRVAGGVRRLELPPASNGKPWGELPTTIRFVDEGHLIAVTFFEKGPPRRVVCDTTVDPPRLVLLQAIKGPPEAHYLHHSFQADISPDGDLIIVEDWTGAVPGSGYVACYGHDGLLRWRQKLDHTHPRWVIAADDQSIAALVDDVWLTTVDTRTGSVLDSQKLWETTKSWPTQIREIAFHDDHLMISAFGALDGITPVFLSVAIANDGAISLSEASNDWVWGLGMNRPSCGALVKEADEKWLIAGFKK